MTTKKTILDFISMKKNGTPLTWITAYDLPFAQVTEEAGIDMILVGDSGGMVQLGYPTTNPGSTVDGNARCLHPTCSARITAAAKQLKFSEALQSRH